MAASFMYTTFAVGPMPPYTEKTSGEKHPCSTSLQAMRSYIARWRWRGSCAFNVSVVHACSCYAIIHVHLTAPGVKYSNQLLLMSILT